jgi:hypothetical protein
LTRDQREPYIYVSSFQARFGSWGYERTDPEILDLQGGEVSEDPVRDGNEYTPLGEMRGLQNPNQVLGTVDSKAK